MTTTYDFQDGNGPVPAHQHSNGGGWVADTAKVHETAYIGPDAKVFGNAEVIDYAKVDGNAKVSGHAKVSDYAKVYNDVVIFGAVKVSGNARVFGDAKLFNSAWVSGHAKVFGNATIYESRFIDKPKISQWLQSVSIIESIPIMKLAIGSGVRSVIRFIIRS